MKFIFKRCQNESLPRCLHLNGDRSSRCPFPRQWGFDCADRDVKWRSMLLDGMILAVHKQLSYRRLFNCEYYRQRLYRHALMLNEHNFEKVFSACRRVFTFKQARSYSDWIW